MESTDPESVHQVCVGTPEERHRVRIAAKKARYAMEFFQGLYPGGRAKRSVQRLSALQDALGWLNDAAVGALSARSCARSSHIASLARTIAWH